MRMAVFCQRTDLWNKRLLPYMKIYRECCMENLQADWIHDKRGLLEQLQKERYDMIVMPPEILADTYGDFAQLMDAACRGEEKGRRMYLWNFRGNSVLLEEEEIAYLYSEKRKTYVSDGTRDYRICGMISREEKKLPQERFIRIHRNCLVNLGHVRRIEGSWVILKSGKKLEVSIRRKKETAERIRRYILLKNETAEKPCESTGLVARNRFL